MEIYIGSGSQLNYASDLRLNVLESFFAIRHKQLKKKKDFVKKFFLDSGAFSAYTQKKGIDLNQYISYIKDNNDKIDYYANLDEIYNPEKSAQNQAKMESEGLKPIPVYHYGENLKIFKKMIDKYNYIAIGGMVPISTQKLIPFLDECFGCVCNKEGNTEKKIHGFGMTTLELMERYPWASVDSVSPILTAAMGGVYNEHGQVISLARKRSISMMSKLYLKEECTPLIKVNENNIKTNPFLQDISFFELRYKYKARIIVNLRYFMALEKTLTENPPRYKNHQTKLLF